MEVKKLIVLGTLVAVLAGLLLSNITDTSASIADSSIPDNEVASNQSKADNSCASASITITMTTAPMPDE